MPKEAMPKEADKMEAEYAAAERLLLAILSKRGEAVSGKLLQKLISWAKEQGFFKQPQDIFTFEEWRQVGDKMWDLTVLGKDRDIKDLKLPWKIVINVLESMRAESRVAAAAVQALSPTKEQAKIQASHFACPVQADLPLPMKGLTARPCQSITELIRRTETPQVPVVIPPRVDMTLPSAPPPLAEKSMIERHQEERQGGAECRPSPTDVPLPPSPSMKEYCSRRSVERCEKMLRESDLAEGQGKGEERMSLEEIIKQRRAANGGQTVSRRWSGIIRDAIVEGDWTPSLMACPVVRGQDGEITYVKHEWKTLHQAIRTVRENGHKSETARALINWLHTSEMNIPSDCSELARLLLTPSQYLIWLREWERLAREEVNRPRDPADPLGGLTSDMLLGRGRFENADEQVHYPQYLLELVGRTAIRAYDAVPDTGGPVSFTNVRQGVTEHYSHFIDRLHAAIMNSAQLAPDNKESMFRLLAFENANAKTKSMLATLPKTAEVSDMIELTARAEQGQQAKSIAGAVAAAIQPTTSLVAAAVQQLGKKQKERPSSTSSVTTPKFLIPDNSDADLDSPFDLVPVDPEKKPDLHPPDSHDKWATVKGKGRWVGDADVLCAYVC